MNCQHQSRTRDRGSFTCALGLYGGRPYLGNCAKCIATNQNTPEFVAELEARRAKSHPAGNRRISGCCDSAINP